MAIYVLELPILPVFISLAGRSKLRLVLCIVFFFVFVTGLWLIQKKKKIIPKVKIDTPLLTSLITLIFAAVFYFRWADSRQMWYVSKRVHLPQQMACAMIALFLALLSLPGINHAVSIVRSLIPEKRFHISEQTIIVLFLFLTALMTMFLNSRSSLLYPMNDWTDPNTMFTVGKGVLKGYVPYRDLYEQKGPLLLFLHTAGAAISYTSFFGVWIFEVIACFCYLYFMFKTSTLFFKNKACITVPLIALITYSAHAFHAEDTAEEFSLALLSYSLYIGCKALLARDFPSKWEFFFIGITSGCVFWGKYSLTGFYVGWFLYFLLFAVTQKQTVKLIKGVCGIFLGIITVSIPVFVYFLVNNAFESLFQAYFWNNLFTYAETSLSFIEKMQVGLNIFWRFAPMAVVFCVLGVVWSIIRRQWHLLTFMIMTFLGTFIMINIGGIYHIYTSLILTMFSFIGTFWLLELYRLLTGTGNETQSQLPGLSAVSLMISLFFLCRLSHSMALLQYKKEDMFQYKLKSIIESSSIENPTILHYGIGETGINTVNGSIPAIRFFCVYNNEKIGVQEEQTKCIQEQCADFIIYISKDEAEHPTFDSYEYKGAIEGPVDNSRAYCHYFTPKKQ